MKKLFAFFMLALLVLTPVMALAAEFRVSEENNGTATLSGNETAKNLYAAGNTVDVSGAVKGDLVAAGNTLNLQGDTESNLIAAGANVNLDGKVGRNAKLAGSNINVNKNIGEDLFAAAATLNIGQNAEVGGDLYAATGNLTLNGEVAGRVRVAGGDVTINGKIGGDLVVDGGKLTLGDKAVVGGKLILRAPQEASISPSAVVKGKVDYQKIERQEPSRGYGKGMFGAFGFFGLLLSLVLLLALVYILPRTSRALVASSLSRFWPSLGWGFLLFAVTPSVLILLAITVIGLKVAGMLALLYLLYLLVSFTYGTLALGTLIFHWIEKKEYRVDWLTVLIGVVASTILALIPFLGWLVVLAFGLVVLGQLVVNTGAYLKSQHRK